MILYFTCTIKGRWGFCALWFPWVNTSQGIPLVGMGKARVVTECNVVNGVGWNVASRFGFNFRVVGREAKGERNESAGWPERNGMNGSTLAWVAEAGG